MHVEPTSVIGNFGEGVIGRDFSTNEHVESRNSLLSVQ